MKRKRNSVRGNVCVGVIAVHTGLREPAVKKTLQVKKQKEEVTMMKPIKTEADYRLALGRLEQIFDARPGTEEGDELEVLAILVEHYENQRFPIDLPDPVEAIQFRMEQLGLKQNDLAKLVGSKSHMSEVLNRKRKLTLEMIRRLSKALAIPAEVLIQTY